MKSYSLAYNWHESRDKRSLGRYSGRSWCHHHTSVTLYWLQPMAPWTLAAAYEWFCIKFWCIFKGYNKWTKFAHQNIFIWLFLCNIINIHAHSLDWRRLKWSKTACLSCPVLSTVFVETLSQFIGKNNTYFMPVFNKYSKQSLIWTHAQHRTKPMNIQFINTTQRTKKVQN